MKIEDARDIARSPAEHSIEVLEEAYECFERSALRVRHAHTRSDMMMGNQLKRIIKEKPNE